DEPTGWLGARYYDEAEGRVVSYRVQRLWAGLGISFVAGGLSGLLGIGGGVFKVPALHLACQVPIKAAAATSNFMIGVTAAASAFLYYGRGEVRPALTAAVVLGVLAGSALGSIVNRKIHGRFVSRLFAVLLIMVALQMFYRVWKGA
ncbi:MAG: sulfite exporter TauE/SafE family protein, partial [Isosphaeraceae bacterium]|nr:sulfite exporter TauE/SafE family protein [Isosphaeraceae bacterium]